MVFTPRMAQTQQETEMKHLIALIFSAAAFGQAVITPSAPGVAYAPTSLSIARPAASSITMGITSVAANNGNATLSISAIRSLAPSTLSASGLSVVVTYTNADVASMACAPGPTLVAAGKTLSVNAPVVGGSTTATIVGVAVNANTIGDGVWAICTFTGVNKTTLVSLSTPVAANKFGKAIATTLSPNPGTISVQALVAAVFSCDGAVEVPGNLQFGEQDTCHAGFANNTGAAVTVFLALSGPDAAKMVLKDTTGTVITSCTISNGSSQCNFIREGI